MLSANSVFGVALLVAVLGLFCSGWLAERWSRSLTVTVARARLAGWWACVGRLVSAHGARSEGAEPATTVLPRFDTGWTDIIPGRLVRPYADRPHSVGTS